MKAKASITLSTILFGILSHWLTGFPYMAWGFFDPAFFGSFALWAVYCGVLYLSVRGEYANDAGIGRLLLTSLGFGLLAAGCKLGLDAVTERLVGSAENLLIAAFMMEVEILLFGTCVLFFLLRFGAKRKFLWDSTLSKYAGGLTAVFVGYTGFMVYQLLALKGLIAEFSQSYSLTTSELDRGAYYLYVKYARESTLPGTIAYVLFFILLWMMLEKGAKALESSEE